MPLITIHKSFHGSFTVSDANDQTFDGATATNSVTNEITIATHPFATGDVVVYSDGGGTPIPGLVSGQHYYVISVDANTIQLAANKANALATPPVPIDITNNGLVATQDETNYDGSPTSEGTFVGGDGVGGTAYIAAETITLSNGAQLTVDAVDGNGDVTQFTVNTSGTTATAGVPLTQSSTSGTGVGFTLTPGPDNLLDGVGAAHTLKEPSVIVMATNFKSFGFGATAAAAKTLAFRYTFDYDAVPTQWFTLGGLDSVAAGTPEAEIFSGPYNAIEVVGSGVVSYGFDR